MGRRNRECYLCGSKYEYCPTCFQDRTKPVWMAEFHSENCKNIFDICTRFNMNLLTKSEAKSEIEKCDLSNKPNFRPSVQNTLSNLLKDEYIRFSGVDLEFEEIPQEELGKIEDLYAKTPKIKKPNIKKHDGIPVPVDPVKPIKSIVAMPAVHEVVVEKENK